MKRIAAFALLISFAFVLCGFQQQDEEEYMRRKKHGIIPAGGGGNPVTYDNSVAVGSGGVTSLTSGAFTITSNANRACIIFLALSINTATGVTATCGTASASLIIDTGTTITYREYLFCVAAPATGSRTASASWTGSANAWLGAVTAYNVDQTTPCNNSQQNASASIPATTLSITVSSNNGDLTASAGLSPGSDGTTTNQTQKWVASAGLFTGDVGPGTGTTTHTWTTGSHVTFATVGANLKKSP